MLFDDGRQGCGIGNIALDERCTRKFLVIHDETKTVGSWILIEQHSVVIARHQALDHPRTNEPVRTRH
jgi:hypothetical protein